MQGNDGTLHLNEKDGAKFWKAHMQKNMNEENELDQIADAYTVLGTVERVLREETKEAFMHLKIGKAPGLSEAYEKMILASRDAEIRVLRKLYQRILDVKRMPAEWSTSVAITIF